MLALTLLATTYSTGFEAVKSIETPSTNPYWQPGAGLTRVRPAIGPTVFDVTQYGAVGDKVHDDTKAIQTALDECVKSHDGGVVLLPNKKAPSNTTAVGSGDRAQQCGPAEPGNYPGSTITSQGGIHSADACCAFCTSTSGCECWDLNTIHGTCYAKKDCGTLQEEEDRVTGKMGGPPSPTPTPPTPGPSPGPSPPAPPPGPGVPRGALSEPVIPAEDGSIYLSLPLVLDHATGCAIVIEPHVTLLQKPWSTKPDRYKGAFIGIDNSDNCAIGGGGKIRGNGQEWWFGRAGSTWPELISVSASNNIALFNITAMDSAFHHLEMFAGNFEISHMQILIDWNHPSSGGLEYSPCTDGIDVHGTPAYIHNTVIDVGDDNIAVHASDVLVEDCHFGGPATCDHCVHGHGATIGSLTSKKKVENVKFTNIVMERINEGPRIKVRCNSKDGYAKDITYENLVLHNIGHKNFNIFTDYDCKKDEGDADKLPTGWETIRRPNWSSNSTLYRSPDGEIFRSLANAQAAAAAAAPADAAADKTASLPLEDSSDNFVISNLVFKNITTTGTHEQGGFSCSKDIPCKGITMSGIHSDKADMQCHYADGTATDNSPAITCL